MILLDTCWVSWCSLCLLGFLPCYFWLLGSETTRYSLHQLRNLVLSKFGRLPTKYAACKKRWVWWLVIRVSRFSAQAYEWQPCHCGGANCAMVNHPMTPLPPKAAELVREYNVWTSREDPGGLYNFVTGIWTQQQDGTYVAEIMKPHVPNHEYFVNKDDPSKTTGGTCMVVSRLRGLALNLKELT